MCRPLTASPDPCIISRGSGLGCRDMRSRRLSSAVRRGWADLIVVMVVVAALVVVMVPVLRRTYRTALTLRCRQQLLAIFAAVQSYAIGYNGHPPGGGGPGDWRDQIDPLLDPDGPRQSDGRSRLWQCPADGAYVGNAGVFGAAERPLGSYMLKSEIGLVADGAEGCGSMGDSGAMDWRHRGGANVIFLDGHVQWVPKEKGGWIRRRWDKPQ